MLTFDDPGTKHDHSYKAAPWFISTRGYGFHPDSSAESSFDMRAGAPGRFVVTNRFSTLRFNLVYGARPDRRPDPLWIDIVVVILMALGVYGFVTMAGFHTHRLTSKTDRRAEDMYDKYADSPRRRHRRF